MYVRLLCFFRVCFVCVCVCVCVCVFMGPGHASFQCAAILRVCANMLCCPTCAYLRRKIPQQNGCNTVPVEAKKREIS